jgi:hypothetical protein
MHRAHAVWHPHSARLIHLDRMTDLYVGAEEAPTSSGLVLCHSMCTCTAAALAHINPLFVGLCYERSTRVRLLVWFCWGRCVASRLFWCRGLTVCFSNSAL